VVARRPFCWLVATLTGALCCGIRDGTQQRRCKRTRVMCSFLRGRRPMRRNPSAVGVRYPDNIGTGHRPTRDGIAGKKMLQYGNTAREANSYNPSGRPTASSREAQRTTHCECCGQCNHRHTARAQAAPSWGFAWSPDSKLWATGDQVPPQSMTPQELEQHQDQCPIGRVRYCAVA